MLNILKHLEKLYFNYIKQKFINILNTKNNQSSLKVNFYKQKYLEI
jgi:hypothetical protein